MGHANSRVLYLSGRLAGNQYIVCFAAKLLVYFVNHPDAAGTNRVSEALQPAIGVDRQASMKVKEARVNILLCLSSLAP